MTDARTADFSCCGPMFACCLVYYKRGGRGCLAHCVTALCFFSSHPHTHTLFSFGLAATQTSIALRRISSLHTHTHRRQMHKLFGGRHHSPPKVNKPLPEPLVDPDEGKTPIGKQPVRFIKTCRLHYTCNETHTRCKQATLSLSLSRAVICPTESGLANRTRSFSSSWATSPRGAPQTCEEDKDHDGRMTRYVPYFIFLPHRANVLAKEHYRMWAL